jgi:hypothetical protein
MFQNNGLLVANASCKICGKKSDLFDEAKILARHDVKYYRCASCGYIQSETPYWLEEAYSFAISRLDTGIMVRNLANRIITSAIIDVMFPKSRSFLDYAAGHGVFVRLMRDLGYEYHWYDLHAVNDYARGFEHRDGMKYDFLTAYEVLEHLVDPYEDLDKIMSLSDNVLVSTELLPTPTPKIAQWWYYAPRSGQHVSFYTLSALREIAQRYGRNLLSCGYHHLFTRQSNKGQLFQLLCKPRIARLVNAMHRRPSFAFTDFELFNQDKPADSTFTGLGHSINGERR